jgi:hypothetical protein
MIVLYRPSGARTRTPSASGLLSWSSTSWPTRTFTGVSGRKRHQLGEFWSYLDSRAMALAAGLAWPATRDWASALRLGGRDAPALIDLEDRHRDVESPTERVEQASLLPGVVVAASQSDEDVIRLEGPDRVLECRERRVVGNLSSSLRVRGERFDVPEDDAESLVSLVTGAVRIRREPANPAHEDRRDHEDLRRRFDKRPHQPRKLFDARGSFAGRDQKARLRGRRHVGIMPPVRCTVVTARRAQRMTDIDGGCAEHRYELFTFGIFHVRGVMRSSRVVACSTSWSCCLHENSLSSTGRRKGRREHHVRLQGTTSQPKSSHS